VPKSRTKGRLEALREILAAKTVEDVITLKGKYQDVELTSDDVAAINEHIARLGKTEAKREYTPRELAGIAKVFYEAQTRRRATVFAWTPLYTSWESLAQIQRDETIRGLQGRIEREGLEGYLERKRPEAGAELTEEIVHELERQGYL